MGFKLTFHAITTCEWEKGISFKEYIYQYFYEVAGPNFICSCLVFTEKFAIAPVLVERL